MRLCLNDPSETQIPFRPLPLCASMYREQYSPVAALPQSCPRRVGC